MARARNVLSVCALLFTLVVFQTLVSPELEEDEPFLPQSRQKRSEPLSPLEYDVVVELNLTDVDAVQHLRTLFSSNSSSLNLTLTPLIFVSDIHMTTVCYPNGTSYQCRCEDQYVWSYNNCVTYGACDEITDGACTCISDLPSNGQYCQPKTVEQTYEYIVEVEISASNIELLEQIRQALTNMVFPVELNDMINITQIEVIFIVPEIIYEYEVFIEVNTTDADELKNILNGLTFPVQISPHINVSDLNITTVCIQDDAGIQCRCEEDYIWPCDTCAVFEPCDHEPDNICSCIRANSTDGQYCQSKQGQNLTACFPTTPIPTTTTVETSVASSTSLDTTDTTTSTTLAPSVTDATLFTATGSPSMTGSTDFTTFTLSSTTAETDPLLTYKYHLSVELNVSDVTLIQELRTLLSNMSNPISINGVIQISDVNITTVCYDNGTSYQCRCEQKFLWPCDKCATYGKCNSWFDTGCGCINAIPPDGQYCQPVDPYNLTSCPITTTPQPQTSPTAVPMVYEYVVSIELNTTDVSVIEQLRNMVLPVSMDYDIQVSDINITTVCSPSSGSYQCRCEEDYSWPCDRCSLYGSCDNATSDSCACINAIPRNGEHCQPRSDLVVCPTPSPSTDTTTITSTTLTPQTVTNTTNATTGHSTTVTATTQPTINNTSTLTSTTSTPRTVTNSTTVATTAVLSSTIQTSVTYPTVTNGTTDSLNVTVSTTDMTPVTGANINTTATTVFSTPVRGTNSTSTTASTTTTVMPTTLTTSPSTTNGSALNTTTGTTPTNSLSTSASTTYNTGANTTSSLISSTLSSTPNSSTSTASSTSPTTPLTVTNSTTPTAMTTTTNFTTPTFTASTTTSPTTPTATTPNSTTFAQTNSTTTTSASITMNSTTSGTTPPVTNISTLSTSTTTANTTTFSTPVSTISTTTTTIASTTYTTSTAPVSSTSTTTLTTTNTTAAATTSTSQMITSSTITTTTSLNTASTTTLPARTTITTPFTNTTTPVYKSTPTTPSLSTSTPQIFDVEITMRLDKTFSPELTNPSSSLYQSLTSQINEALEKHYKGITGFISVGVTSFSQGSVITHFDVQTKQVVYDEIAEKNENLPEAIKPIASIIGSVSALYHSPIPVSLPDLTYTGNRMILKCKLPLNFYLGNITKSEWMFDGWTINDGGRFNITTSSYMSLLEINNVISSDSGIYSCTLSNNGVDFQQEGIVQDSQIKQAPILRLQSELNVKCIDGRIQPLLCCVQKSYTVKWFQGSDPLVSVPVNDGQSNCIRHDYTLKNCNGSDVTKDFVCRVDNPSNFERKMTVTIFTEDANCKDSLFGTGRVGDLSTVGCKEGEEGSKTAVCLDTGKWELQEDACVLVTIKELFIDSEDLFVLQIPTFVANLSKTVKEEETKITNSSLTISTIVDILINVANTIQVADVSQDVIQNVLETVDVIISDETKEPWLVLNANGTRNTSSQLLGVLEILSTRLVGEFSIATSRILLNRSRFNDTFRADLNSSVFLDISNVSTHNVFITTILLSTLYNVMPSRNSTFDIRRLNATSNDTEIDNSNTINAAVVLIKINATAENVLLSYDKLNSSLAINPQCVFWNFTLFESYGAWDDEGCVFVSDINDTVTCSCNHLTSFSLLMATNIPESIRELLDIMTYIGVGISMASLVICLLIEGCVWKAITRNSTAFMRHVSIINTALSLLIANICFIIGASIANNPLENPGENYMVPLGPCSTATFFMHFFYLALFFWMLVSGLLLFYRTVMVLSYMSKSVMTAIGFLLGYGCPLIIAVVTVAVTAPGQGYIRKDEACWLNWIETKALLALVIPALAIVFINFLIVIVVLIKMLRRGLGENAPADEKHTLVVIARCVIILTPLFGLTWSLGVGTMISSTNKGIHIAFAFFNSLQGFFILVFGTLLDSRIRSILARKFNRPETGTQTTRSTSAGISSLSGRAVIGQIFGRRNVYHVSQAANSSNSGAAESFVSMNT